MPGWYVIWEEGRSVGNWVRLHAYDVELNVIRENAGFLAETLGLSSIAVVGDFREPLEGEKAIDFKVGAIEARMYAPAPTREEERNRLLRELALLTEVVDRQLDVLDPEGADFTVKARNWFKRGKTGKKKKADDASNVEQSLICGERLLRRIEILRALRALEKS